MKSNAALGYIQIARCGEYEIGRKGEAYRACGHEWHWEQDASQEFAHHKVCGRGATAEEAVENLISAAIRSAEAGPQGNGMGTCDGLTRPQALALRDELMESLAELV